MLTFEKFSGINNTVPEHRLGAADLVEASDVDIGLSGEVVRRAGLVRVSSDCHKNLWQADGFMLATIGSRLAAIHGGGVYRVVHESLGAGRVWYCNLPDGRTTFTNGLLHGVTDGFSSVERAVPSPETLGYADEVAGDLPAGSYRYHLAYCRASDRLEGPAASSEPISLAGGLRLDGLPFREGFTINVYLSGRDGEGAYLAGEASGSAFDFSGSDAMLTMPCRTLGSSAFPVGTFTATWRGRVITACGSVLWASRPSTTHLCDWRDFKQMPAEITAIVPVSDGLYIGTKEGLAFLSGESWDQLTYTDTAFGPVTPGSGVEADGQSIKLGNGVGFGRAMLCIAGGEVVAGFSGGSVAGLTGGRYQCDASEVCATFREVGGIPQYIAVPQ